MHYSFTKACLLALATATSVLAQEATDGFNVLTAPKVNEVLQAGTKYTIKWSPSDPAAPITLIFMQGNKANNLSVVAEPIAKSIDSALGKFEWSVPTYAPYEAYGIRLDLDSDKETFQYSNPFTIAGGSDTGAAPSETEGEATVSLPTKPAETGKSTTTVQVSQISTAPTTSSTSSTVAVSTSSKSEPTSTSEESTAAPSSTDAPSTTMETVTEDAPSSTEAPTTPPSATPTGAAPRNAVVGSGILGAMVMVFALF
ncbi:hypothetical protein V494_06254 [Pseudogymnoascus sp. VKM F-4513 (FW-928)]|nr:hypothetical protein V494_06254 [Pseudogymnoascus sp. VKM F-4513 (FW-928)]